jgi:hypothetical protein
VPWSTAAAYFAMIVTSSSIDFGFSIYDFG